MKKSENRRWSHQRVRKPLMTKLKPLKPQLANVAMIQQGNSHKNIDFKL